MTDNNENLNAETINDTVSPTTQLEDDTVFDDSKEEHNSDIVDSVDYNFDEISQAVTSFEYTTATKLIKKVFNSDCNDIRIIVYKFFCDIINDDFRILEKHFEGLIDHIEQFSLNQLQPQRTIAIQSENAFNWFTKILRKGVNDCIKQYNLEYPFTENGKLLGLDFDKLIIILNDKFTLDDKFTGILEEIKGLVIIEEEEPPEEEIKAENLVQSDNDSSIANQNIIGVNYSHLDHSSLASGSASTKWLELENNIIIFSELMRQQRFLEAAVFFKDINQQIINFDPREYFPDIFYQLYQAMTDNFDQVCNIIDHQQNSLEWLVTEQLFRINPEKLSQQGLPHKFSSDNKFHELSSQMKKTSIRSKNSSLLDIDSEQHANNSSPGDEDNQDMDSYPQDNLENDTDSDYPKDDNNLENMYKEQDNGAYDYEG